MAHSRSPGTGLCPGAGGWWGQCDAHRAELRDERAPVAPVPQQRGPELKAASYFATRPKPGQQVILALASDGQQLNVRPLPKRVGNRIGLACTVATTGTSRTKSR